jgi:hypothetical protein
MTDVSAATGTTLGVSAGLPATFDAAGYDALTFTDLGEVIDIGELGKAFNVVNHQTVGRAYPQKLKDTFDIANISLTLGRVSTDAGQVLLQTALAEKVSYAFELLLPSGDRGAFTGQVIKAGIGALASGNVETTMIEIAIDPETLFED